MKKIQFGGALPFFSGFYSTIFDPSERWQDYLEDCCEREFDSFDGIDYGASLDNAAREIFDAFLDNKEAKKFLKEFELDLTFDKLYSPAYYNYSNDEIQTNSTITKKGIVKLFDYLSNNFERTPDVCELRAGLLMLDNLLTSQSSFDKRQAENFLTRAIDMVFDDYLTEDQKEGLAYDLVEAAENIENIVFLDN